MIARFFDTTKADELADWIVAEVRRVAPPDLGSRPQKKKHALRARDMDGIISKRVAEFTRTNRLNIYKKARLASRVRDGLSGHGYPGEFVQSFSLEVIERIQAAEKTRTD